jgi:hypothetical protein
VVCLTECDHEALVMRRPLPIKGCCTMKKKTIMLILAGKLCQSIHDLYDNTSYLLLFEYEKVTLKFLRVRRDLKIVIKEKES